MNKPMNAGQELKSERVQEELTATEAPLVIRLKSERVQEPAASGAVEAATVFELAVSQRKKVVIDIWSLQVLITLEDPAAGGEQQAAGSVQAA